MRHQSAVPLRHPFRISFFFAALFFSLLGSASAQQAAPPAPSNSPDNSNPPAQTGATSAPAQPNPDVQADVPAAGTEGKKVIQDQAEYNAFVAASNTQDPTERAEAMEAFAEHYPKSIVAADALEEAMAQWQTVGDNIKVLEVAKELVNADEGNVRALAIVVALDRVSAAQGDQSALDELCSYSTAGMREISMWQKPAGVSDADFAALGKQMSIIFNGAAGYCAMQQRNFSQARDWFSRAFALDPRNLQDLYDLAIADLELTPIDANGFWYCAKAVQMAKASTNADTANGMESYCKPKYATYHGGDDGWSTILSLSATQSELPADFAKGITSAPPPQPAPPAAKSN
jgi:tetratricopeptide (TPR) repeat protein